MKPFPYQLVGANTMAKHPRVYNADQPGLGKTLQALLGLQQVDVSRWAVLCPAIARTHWRNTTREVLHLEAPYVESYDKYVRNVGVREHLKVLDPQVLILDEAHMLSNMAAERTREILLHLRHVPVIWPMSGTPLRTNGPAGVFPLLAAAWPNELKARDIRSYHDYLEAFTSYYEHPRWGVQVRSLKNVAEWQKLWAKISFRRTMRDVLPEMPPLLWEELVLDPSRRTAEVDALREYERTSDLKELREALDCMLVNPEYAGTAELRRLTGEAKAPFSAEIIKDELEGGTDRIFVTAYHRSVLDVLERELDPYGVVRVDGSTSEAAREKARIAFQTTDKYRVYLGQIMATQMSVTLTAAAVTHMVEPTWVSDDNIQSARRIHRIGQGRPCVVRMHSLAKTLDEAVTRVLLRDQQINQQALGEPGAAPLVRTVQML